MDYFSDFLTFWSVKMLIIIIIRLYMDGQKLWENIKNIFKMCFIYGLFTDSIISQQKGEKEQKCCQRKTWTK